MTSSITAEPSPSTSAPPHEPPTSAPPHEPHVLKNAQGEFFAYRSRQYGSRFSVNSKHARIYQTRKGARIARACYLRSERRALDVVPVP